MFASIAKRLHPLTLSATLCAFPVIAFAQPTTPNGYDLLVKGIQLLQPDESAIHTTILSGETMPPAERLRREKDLVERNAAALTLVRQALDIDNPDASPSFSGITTTNAARSKFLLQELARQFINESNVRLANEDAVGAFNSRVDALALGIGVGNGANSMTFLVGRSIENTALGNIAPIVSRLSPKEATVASARLNAIEKRRAPYAEIVEAQKREALSLLETTLKEPTWKEDFVNDAEDETEKQALQNVTAESLKQEVATRWDSLIENAKRPYSLETTTFPTASNSAVALFAYPAERAKNERFLFESARTQTLLLASSLLLKAAHDEKGTYPTTFITPNDPFSDGRTLIYRPFEKTYRLYSIGPDTKDDEGTAILGRVKDDSVGDIMATVY